MKYKKLSKVYPNYEIEPFLKNHPEYTVEQAENLLTLAHATIRFVAAQALEDGLSTNERERKERTRTI